MMIRAEPVIRPVKAFYSPGDVAKLAGVSSTTVLDWIHAGKLGAAHLSPRIYRIPLAAVVSLLYPERVRRPKAVTGRKAGKLIDDYLGAHAREHAAPRARRALRSAS
jgi:excisionase family DNA binding protein